ncbi:oxidoreductase activity protein [[Candida] boidinii]|nr:oxidoreductase activity protein [[Candida] boidinii]OWB66590.1 oxidoreductase activity protein [[Candida] boidinii]OWB83865.1 oxidoreductase activity protein [[Candida] boidinii]GMF51271.1 unnamed protein product [[Candida] boidinii]GMF98505.1 unnamed protein product [[Candida] boidinii]
MSTPEKFTGYAFVGHEIVGTVTAVGPKVTLAKVGDIVGVGAQARSCLKCKNCLAGEETYCSEDLIHTFGSVYPESGETSQGGYANYVRIHEFFTFPISQKLFEKGYKQEDIASFFCGGLTTYAPLVDNGCGPGKKVGVIGIGGLGHFAIQIAKALGAEVYVFSRTNSKKEDALKLGADHYFATSEPNWNKPIEFELDMILSTANSGKGFDLNAYLRCLKINGKFISVGLPAEAFSVSPRTFFSNKCSFSASHLGNRKQMLELLKLIEDKDIKAWIEPVEISAAGCKEVLERLHNNDVKYRFVLTGYEKEFANDN